MYVYLLCARAASRGTRLQQQLQEVQQPLQHQQQAQATGMQMRMSCVFGFVLVCMMPVGKNDCVCFVHLLTFFL